MKNKFELVIPAGQTKIRIDLYLTHHVENATRTKVQDSIIRGEVLVNSKKIKPSYLVQPKDIISIQLSKPEPPQVLPENIPLEIVYEDEFLLVVNKPSGMVTHPAYKNYTGTLVNALLFYSQNLSSSNENRPGIVHRLDKDTSGLLVVAKNVWTHQKLAKQFAEKTTEREYHAICWGVIKNNSGIIDEKLGRSKSDRKKIAVSSDGKISVTEYFTEERFEYLTYLRLKLRTGRTHQIRAHMSHIHHPIFGDATYGGRTSSWGGLTGKKIAETKNLLEKMNHQCLHAKILGFVHPNTKEQMRFESKLPKDFETLLKFLRKKKK